MAIMKQVGAPGSDTTEYVGYPWGQADEWIHVYGCPHHDERGHAVSTPECRPRSTSEYGETGCRPRGPAYLRKSHEGLVLETRERNFYDDSDFYAVVWNPEKGCTENVEYATTRGWTYLNNATVDATPEVRAAYEAWVAAARAKRATEFAAAEAAKPAKGKTVKVVGGRKFSKGSVGEVFWTGPDSYHRGQTRVGVRFQDGSKGFLGAGQVEVLKEAA